MGLQRIVFQKLLIISFGLFIVAADIVFVQNSTNWIEARKECISQEGELSNEEDIGGCENRVTGKKIWTGNHHILSPWLGKKGCFNLVNSSTTKHQTDSVQKCYRLCGKPFFWTYSKLKMHNSCFCMRTIIVGPLPNSACLNGFTSNSIIAWVYDSNKLNISNVDNLKYSGNCVGTRCKNGESVLEVYNCSSQIKAFCQRGTNSTQRFSWKDAEHFCNINNTDFSVTNHEHICNNTDDAVHNSGSYWTGYKRYWYKSTSQMSTESIQSLSEVFNCSYMTCQNEDVTAIHKQGNCSQELDGYACLINGVLETTSKEESSISINFTIRTKNQTTTESNADTSNNQHKGHVTSKQIVSTRELKTTIMNIAMSTTLEKLTEKPLYIVLILVLTVVAVAIISSGVVLAICRVRRQGPFKGKGQETGSQMTEMHDPNYHDFETAPHNASSIPHGNTTYNTHNSARHVLSDQIFENMQSGTASNNEYSVVLKDKKSSSGANEYNFDQKEENSSDIMDNEYDRLNQIRIPGGNCNSKNIYDSSSGLRDEYDPTYNTTSQISSRNKDDNSTYLKHSKRYFKQ